MKTVHLRLWIPVIVFTLTSVLIVGMFFYQSTLQIHYLKQKKIADITHTMIHLQRFIEEALVLNKHYLIEQEILSLAKESEIAELALINPQKIIDYASYAEWKNKSATQIIPALNRHLLALSTDSKPIITSNKPTIITACFPIHYPIKPHNSRSSAYGILYIRYDLSYLISTIYDEIFIQISVFWLGCIILMLLLMAILRQFINKPIRHLITVMENFATDNHSKAQLSGNGELAILGNAFNQLTEKINAMQAHLVKQKNLYNLLSATNQLIIRTQSQQQLFDEICQIAVKKPNLILAWIGIINQQNQQIDIVTQAGSSLNYLQSLFISLNADIPKEQQPTAIAIRENRCVISNHLCEHELTAPQQQVVKKMTIRSSVVFPISKFKQVIGVFTIYSNQTGYFNEDVIALLHEMTSDICFALEKIELNHLKRQAEERFLDVTESSGAYIWELDMQLRYCYLTEHVEAIKGYSVKQLLGKQPFDFMVEADINTAIAIIEKAIQKKSRFNLICQNISATGDILWEEIKGQVVLNEHGEVIKLRGAGMSINQYKQAEAQIIHLEYYDALTCLPNRRLISDHLADKFILAKREGKFGALLLLDLDHFKHINDSLGHEIGDELLIQVANRLKGQLYQTNMVARLGGDEFVILLHDLSHSLDIAIEMVRQVAEKVLLSLREPYLLKEHHYHGNGSIGITLFPLPKQTVATILKQADTALYRAKDSGRNTFQFYRAEMQETADKRLEMEKNLRLAITQQQLQLYYQPQVNHLNKIIGAEVLLRWITPDFGVIAPDQFIPIAEESGLIVEMGYWIFQQSFQQIAQWSMSGLLTSGQHISINVSFKQFKEPDFLNRVAQLVLETKINPALIILELTESVFLDNIDESIEKMLQLRGLGFKFSIDDFGTGYSSLAYLKKLPVSELKIDKAFIDDIEYDNDDKIIVKTIIAMAQNLQLTVIAEGVESQAQFDFLKAHGCLNYQGYFFSKPLDNKTFSDYLRQHN